MPILVQLMAKSASQEPKVSVQQGQATKVKAPTSEELLPGAVAPSPPHSHAQALKESWRDPMSYWVYEDWARKEGAEHVQ